MMNMSRPRSAVVGCGFALLILGACRKPTADEHIRRATAYFEQAHYAEAIAGDPARADAYISLGAIQFVSGVRDEAEATFRRAIEAAPKSVAARLALANFYWASNRRAESEQALKATLEVDPKNAA